MVMRCAMWYLAGVHSRQRKFLKLKDPEVKIHVVGLKNEEANMARADWPGGNQVRCKSRITMEDLINHCKNKAFILNETGRWRVWTKGTAIFCLCVCVRSRMNMNVHVSIYARRCVFSGGDFTGIYEVPLGSRPMMHFPFEPSGFSLFSLLCSLGTRERQSAAGVLVIF